jgi:hypothetical protein
LLLLLRSPVGTMLHLLLPLLQLELMPRRRRRPLLHPRLLFLLLGDPPPMLFVRLVVPRVRMS